MTVIATFSDARATHLISDSLATINKIETINATTEWLSTGVRLDQVDQIKCKYDEGLSKIWLIQPNLALAFAGDVQLASDALMIIADRAKLRIASCRLPRECGIRSAE
jgi:hypothetical protein